MHLKGRKTNTIDIECYGALSFVTTITATTSYCLCNSHQVVLSTESERYLQLQISLEDQPYSTTTALMRYICRGVVKVPGQGSDLQ